MGSEARKTEMSLTRQIAANAVLADPANELLTDSIQPEAYLNLLVEKALFKDALRFFAHAVPVDVTIRWAVDCVKEFKPKTAGKAKDAEALPLCEEWLATRSEDARRKAGKTAKDGGFSSPANCVAMAVFLAGASVSGPGAPPTPPPRYASEKMASGAVFVAVVGHAPDKVAQNYKRAVEMGKAVAKGKGVPHFAG